MDEHTKNINEMFANGLGHNFKDLLERQDDIPFDWNKIKYNAFYRDYDFYEQKFPKGYESISGFNKVIEMIVEKNKDTTPLQEYEKLLNCPNIIGNECDKQISNNT